MNNSKSIGRLYHDPVLPSLKKVKLCHAYENVVDKSFSLLAVRKRFQTCKSWVNELGIKAKPMV